MAERPAGERRKKQRVTRRLPVRFGTEAKMIGGVALDISDGGLRVESAESFPHHSTVDVFVQFPRHSVRLRARIVWSGGAAQEGSGIPVVGLAFVQPEPALAKAYAEWVAEVKLAARAGGEEPAAAPDPASSAPAATRVPSSAAPLSGPASPGGQARGARSAPPAEPKGPVRRTIETRRGNTYAIVLERRGSFWRLTVSQPGAARPELEETCPDYPSADETLQTFIKNH